VVTYLIRAQQTIVFCATRYHVKYLQVLLELASIPATYIYSQLDPTARKINAAKFSARKVFMMVVTDLAARGLDIPLLDNVINYQFPAKSKMFIHRVGRVARAGRDGTAYSLVAQVFYLCLDSRVQYSTLHFTVQYSIVQYTLHRTSWLTTWICSSSLAASPVSVRGRRESTGIGIGIQYSTPDYGIQFSTPDYRIQYSTPDHRIQYSTPDYRIQYSTPDYRMQYSTPDYRIQYSTPD
jgi:hypothetical protein